MRSNVNDLNVVLTNLFVDLRKKCAKIVAGLNKRSKERALYTDLIGKLKREISLVSIKKHTGRRDGVLGCHLTRKEIVKKIGDKEHLVCTLNKL